MARNNSLIKELGCIMIVTGTEIGAGILALPIIVAKLGFFTSSLIMIVAWSIMTYTAILLADISLSMPKNSSFASIARNTLGIPGVVITWIAFLFLMYCISVAYISGAASTLYSLSPNISKSLWSIIFVTVFSSIVIIGISAVDIINRILLSAKLIFLIIVCLIFLQYIQFKNLTSPPVALSKSLLIAIPVIITSFTSHIVVPTLCDYLGRDSKALFRVVFIGSLIPIILYFLWLIAVLGLLPLYGPISFMSSIFEHVNVKQANIGDILVALKEKLDTPSANTSINIFTGISVMTSYLGVSLALYHFNVDIYQLNKLSKQLKIFLATILTFLIPLLVNILNPNLFISAISYVGICIAFMLLLVPTVMAYKLSKAGHMFYYKINQNPTLRYISFLSGITIIFIQFLPI